jgi:hypothetical protein
VPKFFQSGADGRDRTHPRDDDSFCQHTASRLRLLAKTALKKDLSALGGATKQLKMLTYWVYALLFLCFVPCQLP